MADVTERLLSLIKNSLENAEKHKLPDQVSYYYLSQDQRLGNDWGVWVAQ